MLISLSLLLRLAHHMLASLCWGFFCCYFGLVFFISQSQNSCISIFPLVQMDAREVKVAINPLTYFLQDLRKGVGHVKRFQYQ